MESPKTLSLQAAEWSALAIFCVNSIGGMMAQIAQSNESSRLPDEAAKALNNGLERATHLVEAWRRTSQIVPRVAAPSEQPKANGPAPARKRVGWPKGKKRKPAQPTPEAPN
jgi:hypothetical protein